MPKMNLCVKLLSALAFCLYAPLTFAQPPSPVAVWHANEDATDAVGSNDGSFSGSYTSGHVLQAFDINGEDFVSVSASSNSDPDRSGNDDLTITMWIYADSVSGTQHLAGKRADCSSGDISYQMFLSGDEVGIGANPGTGATTSGADIATGTWTFVAGVYDGTEEQFTAVAFDGEDQVTRSGSTSESLGSGGGSTFFVGSSHSSCAGFNGLIDEVRFFHDALTPLELSRLAAEGWQRHQ